MREMEGREAHRVGKREIERWAHEKGWIEPGRAKGVRGYLAKELSLSRKSGPRIKLEYLP